MATEKAQAKTNQKLSKENKNLSWLTQVLSWRATNTSTCQYEAALATAGNCGQFSSLRCAPNISCFSCFMVALKEMKIKLMIKAASYQTEHSILPSGLQMTHTQTIAFRHHPPNSARFGYATEGALFISTQLSTDADSTLLKVRVLIWL